MSYSFLQKDKIPWIIVFYHQEIMYITKSIFLKQLSL
ncbi:hypothetical protein Emtol_3121 [Emticicia oligotrophica DSM 17448]|uniref:Uncharacterized protein n=1 Tax=Emticicia oligotrophica (strain DSM 17448 / CIP 109782 / MTCC 6937 / GPTSA100-15) TaxID=929562 RepID=A0ABN4APZ2_EMTOG|nr:hypothetical protein Emtol_3121 [Emticicia oligotrophica DSM 17448]